VLGTNEEFVTDATLEGAAEFVGMRYAEEYGLAYGPYEALVEEYDGAGPFRRLELAPYRYGARYVRQRVDSPRNLTAVYDDPPRTAEQVVHGYAPDEEAPKSLSVSVEGANSSWAWSDSDVQGELFLRIALGAELDDDRAARAAEGWGADRLLTLERENETGYAWVFRWDDADVADEFRTAFEQYRESRADGSDAVFRTVDVSDATVVVFAGDPAFVGNASASGDTADVTLAP